MKNVLVALAFIINFAYAQVSARSGIYFAKEFSKELALFKAKTFLIEEVLNTDSRIVKFESIPLAASNSGELTTLLYKVESLDEEGLILGFFGDYWNDSGVVYQGYGFKNLNKSQAIQLFDKIEKSVEENKKFLRENNDNNNIVFEFDDMKILIWTTLSSYNLRIYWRGFDSSWEANSLEKSRKRFERKLNN